jgi:hypothetical protein
MYMLFFFQLTAEDIESLAHVSTYCMNFLKKQVNSAAASGSPIETAIANAGVSVATLMLSLLPAAIVAPAVTGRAIFLRRLHKVLF